MPFFWLTGLELVWLIMSFLWLFNFRVEMWKFYLKIKKKRRSKQARKKKKTEGGRVTVPVTRDVTPLARPLTPWTHMNWGTCTRAQSPANRAREGLSIWEWAQEGCREPQCKWWWSCARGLRWSGGAQNVEDCGKHEDQCAWCEDEGGPSPTWDKPRLWMECLHESAFSFSLHIFIVVFVYCKNFIYAYLLIYLFMLSDIYSDVSQQKKHCPYICTGFNVIIFIVQYLWANGSIP